ncbi:MAG: M14 family zinc carboxypeptidase [Bacteroidota bacterium]
MKLLHLFLLCLCYQIGHAQIDLLPDYFQFEPDLVYDSSIESPTDFLNYELGEQMTVYAHTVAYFEKLAAQSDRLILDNYGETYENKPLIYTVITSPENQAKLEELRAKNVDLWKLSTDELNNGIEDMPVVVSFSYNIHGNEASCTEAAMQFAYRLAAAEDQETEDLLDDAIVLLFPCLNPDGRDRYIYWYNSVQRDKTASSPMDLEHHAPWPNGRTNHYWFDLNRDWIWGVHPELRGFTKIYQSWMPQLHADYHEMGYNSNYFTMPGTTPRNLLLPDNYDALADTIGKANIAAFNENKISYFTRESFDFFYPGYGSSYPSIMGAIGMLTEQGGIGGGRAIETNDGNVLTLRQRIFDHYLTSVATLRKAVQNKGDFMRYTYDAQQQSTNKSDVAAYILPKNERDYTHDVIRMLLRQGVEVLQSDKKFSVSDARSFRDDRSEKRDFASGTYVISTDQPRHLFINSIMGRNMAIEDSVMYDMSTWSAPLAYNLEAYATNNAFSLSDFSRVQELGDRVVNYEESPILPYAYIIDWDQRNAPKALAMLWEKGYNVRAATEPFGYVEPLFSRGSLTVLVGRNRDKMDSIESDMAEIVDKIGVEVVPMSTGRMNQGIDLSSNSNRPLTPPRTALLVEPPFSTYTCGQIYFLFDQETGFGVDRIRTSMLQQTAMPKFGSRYGYADLNDYDVLILAGGGGGLRQLFPAQQLQQLEVWIANGGTLVTTESAAHFFTKENWKSAAAKNIKSARDTSDAAKYLSYEDRRDYYGKKNVPGSALLGQIDVTNPLAFGMKKEVYSLKFGSRALEPHPNLQTVGHYHQNANELLVAGYSNRENLESLAGKTFAAVQSYGRGKVVYLTDNTQYRMFWLGSARMMQNAVMLLPSF